MAKSMHRQVAHIMHRHVVTADASTSARECARLIAKERIGCLVILEKG